MAASPVFFDDKSVQMFVTPDKWVNRFYPGITPDEVPEKKLYHDEKKEQIIGTAVKIPKHTHVLYFQPFVTAEKEFRASGATREIYWLNPTNKALTAIKGIKFPQITLDKQTNYVHMHYWANVTAENATVGAFVEGLEPYDELTGEVTEYQRVMCFARGQLYACWEVLAGGNPVFKPTYIFEEPQIVISPGVWNEDNAAEPVLDIHPYKSIFYFKYCTQLQQKNPDTHYYDMDKIVKDWYDPTESKYTAYQNQLFIQFDRPVVKPRVMVIPYFFFKHNCTWDVDACNGPGAPGTFSTFLNFSLSRVSLEPGQPWGLEELTWNTAHHEAGYITSHGTFFNTASNFTDLALPIFQGHKLIWGETYDPNQNRYKGSMSEELGIVGEYGQACMSYIFTQDDITAMGDNTYYGICLYLPNTIPGGHYFNPVGFENCSSFVEVKLTGFPKMPTVQVWSDPYKNAHGLRNNWGITKET